MASPELAKAWFGVVMPVASLTALGIYWVIVARRGPLDWFSRVVFLIWMAGFGLQVLYWRWVFGGSSLNEAMSAALHDWLLMNLLAVFGLRGWLPDRWYPWGRDPRDWRQRREKLP
ncbi:MAG: hypothetical protein NNA23_12960 [Nitrospira sp.]|nr:hypothetical protein [Nitrospira sp.]